MPSEKKKILDQLRSEQKELRQRINTRVNELIRVKRAVDKTRIHFGEKDSVYLAENEKYQNLRLSSKNGRPQASSWKPLFATNWLNSRPARQPKSFP